MAIPVKKYQNRGQSSTKWHIKMRDKIKKTRWKFSSAHPSGCVLKEEKLIWTRNGAVQAQAAQMGI